MNCHSVRNVLDLRAENILSPRRAKAVDAHLLSCSACRALTVPRSSSGTVKASDALRARLLSSLQAKSSAQVAGPSRSLSLWPKETPAIALAAAALALLGGLIATVGAP